MKINHSILRVMILALVFVFLLSSLIYADSGVSEVIDDFRHGQSGGPLSKLKIEIKRFSGDIFDIVRYVVVAILVTFFLLNLSKFANAGDQPMLKSSLQKKMLFQAIGIILAFNFWKLLDLFTGIDLF